MSVHKSISRISSVALALAVHLLTASGALLAFWAVVLIVQGEGEQALRVLALAAVIDAFDGTVARRLEIHRRLPQIDGGLLDNLVDYLTWTFVPLFWAWTFLGIPFWVCAAALVASVFGFSHTDAKTSDNFFRGFPSYWNVLVLYTYLFELGPTVGSVIILICAVMVLIPFKFLYPSRTPHWYNTTMVLSAVYMVIVLIMMYNLTAAPAWLPVASLFYPVYYVILSFALVYKKHRAPRGANAGGDAPQTGPTHTGPLSQDAHRPGNEADETERAPDESAIAWDSANSRSD